MRRPQGALFVIPLQPQRLVLPGVLLAGVIALLLCQRSSTAYAPIPTDPPPELRLVFPDTFYFQRVNVSALADRELFKVLAGTLQRLGDRSEREVFLRGLGVALSDLDAVAMMGSEQNHVNIVTTRKVIETKKILAALAPKATEQSYKGKVFHVGAAHEWFAPTAPFPGDKDFPRDVKDRIRDFPRNEKDKIVDKGFPTEKPIDVPREIEKDRDFRKEGDGPQEFNQKEFPRDGGFPGREGPMRLDLWSPAVYFLSERTYVAGRVRDVMAFIDTAVKPDEKHPLYDALAAAGKHHIAAALALPEEMGREMRWSARRELRGGPFGELTYHNIQPLLTMKKVTLTADVGEESRLDSVWTFSDDRAAGKAQDSARFLLQMLKGSLNYLESELSKVLGGEEKTNTKMAGIVDRLKEACADAAVKADGSTLKVGVKVKTDTESIKAVMAELAPRLELAARRATSANNLKQLALAMHMYHDSMGSLPPLATQIDRQGKTSGLSWRVHLLPYMEQLPLYRQFHLDEPWDSDHNKKLIPMRPKTFDAPGKKNQEAGLTYYQAFTTTPDEAMRSIFPLLPNARMRFAHIVDGLSNTLAFVEAAEPVVWTKPDDIVVDFKQKVLPKLGGVFEDGFNAALADGSVRFLRKKEVTEEFLKAAITAAGGEDTNWPGAGNEDEDMPRRYRDKENRGDKDRWRGEKKETRPIKKIAPDDKKDPPIDDKKVPAPEFPQKDVFKKADRPLDKFERPVDKFTDKK